MTRDYITLNDALSDYFRVRRGRYAASTWEAHERCLEKWRLWVTRETQPNVLLEMVANPDDRLMERYCNRLRPPAYSPSSFNNMRQYLGAFWKYCLGEGWIRTNPMRHVDPLRIPRTVRLQLSPVEMVRLVEECDDPRDRVALALGCNTALRGGDIAKLYVGSANLTDDTLTAFVHKTGKEVQFAITADLRRELLRWFDHYAAASGLALADLPNDWRLIPKEKSTSVNVWKQDEPRRLIYLPHTTLAHPERIVQRALARLGHATYKEGFHTLRRSSARAIYEHSKRGGHSDPLRMAQTLLDHQSRGVTEVYLGITPEKEELAGMMRGKSFLRDGAPDSVSSITPPPTMVSERFGSVPEKVVRELYCDRPGHGDRPGRRWILDNADEARQVILCPACEKPVVEVAQFGPVAQGVLSRLHRPELGRGLGDARLETLIKPNPGDGAD